MKESAKPVAALETARIVSLLMIALIAGLYFVLRYAGHWTENDTAALTLAIRNVSQSGQLVPDTGAIYSSGYSYQVVSAFILNLTGLDAVALQQLVYPLAIVLLVLPAWALFREISASPGSATLGTILLLSQPEFLFAVLRGSHEKFGRLLLIFALFLLFRSFRSQARLRDFAIWVALFYLSVYGLIASNLFFGTSFVSAIAFAFIVGAALERVRFSGLDFVGATTQRFMILTLACFALAFLFAFYAYPPAEQTLRVMDTIADRVRALFLEPGSTTNVYQRVVGAWNNPVVYAMVNAANLVIVLVPFSIWAWQSTSWLLGKQKPERRTSWLLWLLYGAFGFQAALSIVSDASGLFGNLQHRIFPSLSLLGVALISDNIGRWITRLARPSLVRVLSSVVILALAALSLVKATNEASLVGYWTFYTEPELQAVGWFDTNAEYSTAWVGFSKRLVEITHQVGGESASHNSLDAFRFGPATPYFLLSDMIVHESARSRSPLPDVAREQLIYDSGTARLFHRRPRTPYQR